MSRRHTSRSASARLLASTVAMVVAIGALLPGTASAQPSSIDPNDLENARWQLLQYRDARSRLDEVPPGASVTFLPFAGEIRGAAACSEYRALFSVTPQSITVQPPSIDRVECDPADSAIDDAFYAALAAAASLSIEGDILTLYDVIDEPLLVFTSAQIPLDPTIARWELARIGRADGSIDQVRGVIPEVEFLRGGGDRSGRTGRIVGTTGCGSFLGSYQTGDSTIRISEVAYRLGDCTPELARQAEAFIETLAEITDFDVLPAGLSLEDSSGATRLALVPQIDLGERIWTPTELLERDGSVSPLSGRLATSAVAFFGGSAEGRSICRGFDGDSLGSGLALSVSRIRNAKGRCADNQNPDVASPKDIEDAFLGALTRTSSHALRGDELELLDRRGSPIMRLEPQADLVGPTWVLTRLDTDTRVARKGRRAAIVGQEPTATFTGIGVLTGETGTEWRGSENDYTAFFTTPGAAQIDVETPDVQGTACRGNRARTKACIQERDFLALLQQADGYIVQASELRLLDGPVPILWFRPEASDAGDG